MFPRISSKNIAAILQASRYHALTRLYIPSQSLPKHALPRSIRIRGRHTATQISASDNAYVAGVSHKKINECISRLDPYLPLELRSGTWLENLASFKGVRPPETLLSVLENSRSIFPHGILSYVGLIQGRWEAIEWLCQALADYSASPQPRPGPALTERYPWPKEDWLFSARLSGDGGWGLWGAVELVQQIRPSITTVDSLDVLTGSSFAAQELHTLSRNLACGQIWLCLGHAVIETARQNWANRSEAMSFVYQQIAKMHSQGLISPSIYLFDSGEIPSSLRKPPLLHLMSSRLMAILSDAMWKVTESQIMGDAAFVAATYAYRGEHMPGSELNPRVRHLHPELWLEFILWSCVHGGHFLEAVDLLKAISQPKTTPPWKTIGWGRLQYSLEKELLNLRGRQTTKSWFNRVTSTDEGYNQAFPLVSLEKHTISREVVFAVSHGVLSTHTGLADDTRESLPVQSYLEVCKALLGRTRSQSEAMAWNSALYRAMDLSGTVNRLPELVDESSDFIFNAGSGLGNRESFSWRTSMIKECLKHQTSPKHAMYLRQLEEYIEEGSVHNAFMTLRSLQRWTDLYGEQIAADPPEANEHAQETYDVQAEGIESILPKRSVAMLLDLITASKMYEIGRMLLSLCLGDLDSLAERRRDLTIPPSLEAAILRFSNATSDTNLLIAILNRGGEGRKMFSNDSLRELVHAQIAARDWVSVGLLLDRMRSERVFLTAVDIARIASRLLCITRGFEQSRERSALTELLMGVLGHLWLPSRDFSQLANNTSSRELSQISKVLADVSEEYLGFASQYVHEQSISMRPISLPTGALNVLLETILTKFGSEKAQAFAERWCAFPLRLPYLKPESETNLDGDGDSFKPFVPNLQTLRILVSPYLTTTSSQKDPTSDNQDDPVGEHLPVDKVAIVYQLPSLRHEFATDAAYYDSVIQRMQSAGSLRESDAPYPCVYWAMTVCDNLGLDPSGTFQDLLTPMEDASTTAKTKKPSVSTADQQLMSESGEWPPDGEEGDAESQDKGMPDEGPIARDEYGGLIVDR